MINDCFGMLESPSLALVSYCYVILERNKEFVSLIGFDTNHFFDYCVTSFLVLNACNLGL